MQSIQREALVETLLNSLEAERYVRGPLLLTVVDELSASEGLEIAAEAARAILEAFRGGELGAESEFALRIRALRQLVRALSAPPESGEVLIGDALSRAVPRNAVTAATAATAA